MGSDLSLGKDGGPVSDMLDELVSRGHISEDEADLLKRMRKPKEVFDGPKEQDDEAVLKP